MRVGRRQGNRDGAQASRCSPASRPPLASSEELWIHPETPLNPTIKRNALGVAVGLWVAALVTSAVVSSARDNRPGETGKAPSHWPADAGFARESDRWTLLAFAHPRCPCTRATLSELERIVARCRERLAVQVLCCLPEGAPEGWERTPIWAQAERIPGARVAVDSGGAIGRRFGAHTSGAMVLYDPEGRLRFYGGITGSRGHEGDNAGRSAVIDIVLHGQATLSETPTFGCPLLESDACGEASS
jgi:hypothetical protein